MSLETSGIHVEGCECLACTIALHEELYPLECANRLEVLREIVEADIWPIDIDVLAESEVVALKRLMKILPLIYRDLKVSVGVISHARWLADEHEKHDRPWHASALRDFADTADR